MSLAEQALWACRRGLGVIIYLTEQHCYLQSSRLLPSYVKCSAKCTCCSSGTSIMTTAAGDLVARTFAP